ncbi:MAG: 4Fe-4S cluster-binding domain-containing protein [candidate division Zixibacteria bacterium]|nr:4Fe-4S cluster-binding domain-containing protein [candidate division Zixibacteria bacterium]
MKNKIEVPYLEFNLTDHCNLKCRYCSQLAPFNKVKYAEPDTFERDLAALSKVYHSYIFRFVGGDPLLHKRLPEFVRIVRNSGIAEKIIVCTNGLLLDKISDTLYKDIDALDISWYPALSLDESKLFRTRQKCIDHDTRLTVSMISDFQLNQLDFPIDNQKLVRRIFHSCLATHYHHCHTFYEGYYYKCSKPIYLEAYLRKKGVDSPGFQEIDGVALHAPDLYDRIEAYRDNRNPLESCSYCLGTVGKSVKWEQYNKDELNSLQPSRVIPVEELIDFKQLNRILRKLRLYRMIMGRNWLHKIWKRHHKYLPLFDHRYDPIEGFGEKR